MRERKGWLYPEVVEIPEQCWYKMEFGDSVQWDLDREGHEELARQVGMESLTSKLAAHGVTDGIVYTVVESTLVIPEGQFAGTYTSIQGADTASRQVREPDYVSGVAESRAVKRVIKRALGIRSSDKSSEGDVPSSGKPKASEMFDIDDDSPTKNTNKTDDDQSGITW